MGTSLTPEFWRQFAVLLVAAMAVTFVLSAALDALYLRRQVRRAERRYPDTTPTTPTTPTGTTTRRPHPTAGRPLVKS
ncbi:hypothetical protein ACIBL8_05195 [Streptomyces sp. NPDC050523]|uniref:hypothetical protein n=1 Tax=Streptomyces sp. NPDC050523 TaxID=3365622 RepID=UPI0037ADD10C